MPDIRASLERSPVVWLLATLTTGFVAGWGASQGLQQYSGMTMLTKKDLGNLESKANSCAAELKTVSESLVPLREKTKELDTCLADLHRQREQFMRDLDAIPNEEARLRLELARAQSEARRISTLLSDARFQNNQALTRVREFEQTNEDLRRKNLELTHPSGINRPVVMHTSQRVEPNSLVSYLDGALTVVAKRITRNDACLTINGEGPRCSPVEAGSQLRVPLGGKAYAIRVDAIHPPTTYLIDSDWSDANSTVSLALLLLPEQ